ISFKGSQKQGNAGTGSRGAITMRPTEVDRTRLLIRQKDRKKDGVVTRSETLKQKASRELREYFIISLYLWVVFGLFLIYKSMIHGEERVSYIALGVAAINALVLGNFILIARAFPLGDTSENSPLISPTLLKSFLFSIVVACCKILEDAAVGFF